MVLLEAAASALPIVATDVGGTSEIVRHDVSGFVVPPHDSGALATAMKRIEHLSAEERLAMGNAGRAHVAQHYGLPAVVDQWEEIYQSLLQRKCASHSNAQSLARI